MQFASSSNNVFGLKLHVLHVLGLAEMELSFFRAACMVPYFGFVAKPVLITHECFG